MMKETRSSTLAILVMTDPLAIAEEKEMEEGGNGMMVSAITICFPNKWYGIVPYNEYPLPW